jgi:enoyl-CoA hydratase/carnithine racemase
MMDMMLTGRTYGAEEGLTMGLSHYLVEPGKGFEKGVEIAKRIAENTLITNYAIMHALPRIADGDRPGGYMMESLMAAIASGSEEAQSRLRDFLEKRAPKALHNKG